VPHSLQRILIPHHPMLWFVLRPQEATRGEKGTMGLNLLRIFNKGFREHLFLGSL
jgi:hypothetical protein